jgi:serine protease inhibitor
LNLRPLLSAFSTPQFDGSLINSMKQIPLIAAILLGACAAPVGQPVATTAAAYSPPRPASAPVLPPGYRPCCSSPTIWPDPPPPPTAEERQAAIKASRLPSAPAGELAVAKGNRAFAVSLYQQLAAKPGNLFISPISIAGAFGPVAAGARGETRAEIGKVLRFPAKDTTLNSDLGGILRTLQSDGDGHQVNIANALWTATRLPIKPSFIDLTKRSYDAEVNGLDFAASGAAADRINNWVDTKTHGRIPKLFEPDAFDVDTALVITNAVYFLGDWKTSFDPRRTRLQPFRLPNGTARQVPMMHAGRVNAVYLGAGEAHPPADAVELLELPYKGDRLSMVIILPQISDGLPAVEAGLTADKIDKWLASIDAAEPYPQDEVQLPRMQFDSSYDLVGPLKALGMKLAFHGADLTGMSDRGLYIDDVVHKTFVKVDEKGTEAAAATGIVVTTERDHWEFKADHPFLFLIRDKPTGAILFMGRYSEPPSAS